MHATGNSETHAQRENADQEKDKDWANDRKFDRRCAALITM
jgi:hypothetical protein